MKNSFWAEHHFYAFVCSALLLAVLSLPTRAIEPDDEEKTSSRKSKSGSPPKLVDDPNSKPILQPVQPPKEGSLSKPPETSARKSVKGDDQPSSKDDSGELELNASQETPDTKSTDKSSDTNGKSAESKSTDTKTTTKPSDKATGKGADNLTENVLRSPSKSKPTKNEDGTDLSIEAQQKKDQGECPGSEGSKVPTSKNLNDTPLEQEEHPFDAPAAESDDDSERSKSKAPVTKVESSGGNGEDQAFEQRINLCLAYYFKNQENLARRSPWAVMHTILPYGVETNVTAGNRNVNAIGWMCYNGVCKTQRMFQSTKSGFRTNVGPGVQGHEGQFLAILAQSSVPRSFPIMVGKTRYTVSDLIRYEMVTCREKSELTFKLIGLSHYLSPQQTWRDDHGHSWNLEKLVREELDQPVVGAACGGTHRLMGLSYALMMRRRYNLPINNHWARADAYIKDFVQYAWTLQNPDGSFSTDWFEGRANEPDMERKVQTTGHILEWLIFTLPAEDLKDPRVRKSVEFLLGQVYDHRDKDWPIGPRGHSLRAISLYNQRFFGAPTGQLKTYLASAGYLRDVR